MTAWWKQGLKINMPEIGQKDHILKYKALFGTRQSFLRTEG